MLRIEVREEEITVLCEMSEHLSAEGSTVAERKINVHIFEMSSLWKCMQKSTLQKDRKETEKLFLLEYDGTIPDRTFQV